MILFKHSSGLVAGLVALNFTYQRIFTARFTLGKMHLIELPSEEVVYLRARLCLWFNFAGCTWSCSLVYRFEMVSEAIAGKRVPAELTLFFSTPILASCGHHSGKQRRRLGVWLIRD